MKPLSETLSFMTALPTTHRKETLSSVTLEVSRCQSRVLFSYLFDDNNKKQQ